MRYFPNKKLLLFFCVLFSYIYCEYILYYVVIAQCRWPELKTQNSDALKVFILTDIHMEGPRKSHWLDKWRREFQMHRAFQTIISLHQPDVIFLLGDVFNEGEWSSDEQFQTYVDRFYSLFAVPRHISMHILVGNHDIGFHRYISRNSVERFDKAMNSSAVKFITLKDNHFVLLNSMAMEGDACFLCTDARRRLDNISKKLQCSQNSEPCEENITKVNYSRPILLQHFPLYRKSEEPCTEPDAAPLDERYIPFRDKIDAISKEATDYLGTNLQPRVVFGGHTHYGCLVPHSYGDVHFEEHSVPSFSWRNRLEPKYMLVTITPGEHAVNKCSLPMETTIAFFGLLCITFTVYFLKQVFYRR